MKVTVLVFGPYADAVERPSVEIELPDGHEPTAGEVLAALGGQQPRLRELLHTALLAVNCHCVSPESMIHAGDELAIVGLVSGG